MGRYFMTIAYQGASYHGWQRQPDQRTVQGTLEQGLSQLGYPTQIVGSGRTDTGVHAWAQCAHLDLPAGCHIPQLVYQLNAILPPTLRVQGLQEVLPHAHARFHATYRLYYYHIATLQSPFHFTTRYHLSTPLDLDAMNSAAHILLGTHDFRSFCKQASQYRHHHCHILQATWRPEYWGRTFVIQANRFLHGMVRAIVGTLLPIGRHQRPISHLKEVLAARSRPHAGMAAPPHALFLMEVGYPSHLYLPKT